MDFSKFLQVRSSLWESLDAKKKICSLPTKSCYNFPGNLPVTLGGIYLTLMWALKIK